MKRIFGSQTKAEILKYLGQRGGRSGRALARALRKPPTPVFKALRSLYRSGIIRKSGSPNFYSLNPDFPFYDEILSMIDKASQQQPPTYLPKIPQSRRVDPIAIYRFVSERGPIPKIQKLSDLLREKYD